MATTDLEVEISIPVAPDLLVKVLPRDPVVDDARKFMLYVNLLNCPPSHKYLHSTYKGTLFPDIYIALDRYQNAMLNEFARVRQKEKEELREAGKQKKELKKQRREKKELKKAKRAGTTRVDRDQVPLKKLKLVEVKDMRANEKEMMHLEALSSEDVGQQRRGIPPVANSMENSLKLCTKRAEKKNADHSKDS